LSYTSKQIDSQDYVYKPSLFEKVQAENRATEAYRLKWGGTHISGGGDLSTNKFVGRAQIASLSETLTQAPPSKRPRPVLTHSVNLNSNAVEIVDPETPDLNVITNEIKTPSAEMNPEKSATQEALDLPKENQMALYAILIGAGISGYYLMTRLGKKRGRKT
jgi:hypothetical protein